MPQPATPTYRALRGVVRAALRVFYRTVEVTGTEHLDAAAPTILASNHPNSIIDPLLLGLSEQRPVAFCARDGLFRVPLFGRVLRLAHAIPIQRRSDHGATADNDAAFAACTRVLADGGVLSIFPEGKTHADLKVHPLRTGTARIALGAERARGFELGVQIVPVALNYLVRQAFRSDVHVAFGPPIVVDAELRALAERDERAAVRELTKRVEAALRALTVHVEAHEDERIIAQVTSIMVDIRAKEGLDPEGQTPAERTALARRVVEAYRWLEARDPDRTAELHRRLTRYLDERRRLGLGGESPALQHRTEHRSGWTAELDLPGRLAFFLGGAPVAAWGLVNSLAPYLALRALLRVARPRTDRLAVFKLVAAPLLFGGAWTGQTLGVAGLLGPVPAAAYASTLGPSAIFALRYVTEARLHRLGRRSVFGRLGAGDRLAWLRAERKRLEDELGELRREFLAWHEAGGDASEAA